MPAFFRRGRSKVYLLPAVAGAQPTTAELNAGVDASRYVAEMQGFTINNIPVAVTDVTVNFPGSVSGKDVSEPSRIIYYDDRLDPLVRTVQAKGRVVYVVLFPYGTGAGRRCEVWRCRSTGVNDDWSLDAQVPQFAVDLSVLDLPNRAGVAPADPTAPSQGLMIQIHTLTAFTPTEVQSWLQDIRDDHTTGPGAINAVVLQDIADSTGALYTSYLDVIMPFLPGGATPAFTTAYIGTVDLEWTGSGSKYIEGIQSATFRSENVTTSHTAAAAFNTRYPDAITHWYVTYEANLSGFWDVNIADAYRTYIDALMADLDGVRAGRTFMWSPAFWTPYLEQPDWSFPDLLINLTTLFTGLPRPLIMDLQDFVGQSSGAFPPSAAAAWIDYLKTNHGALLEDVQINVEQFTIVGGQIIHGNAVELADRALYYQGQGITLGPSWEIRFWYDRLHAPL